MADVELSRRAQRDLRALRGSTGLKQVAAALDALAAGAANLDVKPLRGAEPWLRLRVGDLRIIYRPLSDEELTRLPARPSSAFLVSRVVNRRDLERAVRSL